jgi:hypothetical protein
MHRFCSTQGDLASATSVGAPLANSRGSAGSRALVPPVPLGVAGSADAHGTGSMQPLSRVSHDSGVGVGGSAFGVTGQLSSSGGAQLNLSLPSPGSGTNSPMCAVSR